MGLDGLWATKSEDVGIIVVQLLSKISNLRDPDPPTSHSDRETDRQTELTDDMQSQYRALHQSASRGNHNTTLSD